MSTSEYSAPRLRFSALTRGRTIGAEGWILIGLILLAAAIRILTIDNQSLWADEALTAYEAGLPFGAMIHTVLRVETTPPLYFVLIWGWVKVFGISPVSLRAISELAGLALVPIAYGATRELVAPRAGLFAAAFVAINPFMIWYSQEARAYMLLAALTGGAFWCFARYLRTPTPRWLIAWAGLSALAITTHFFAAFAVAPEALWLLGRARSRAVMLAVGIVALVQVAMLPFAINDSSGSHGVSWIGNIPISIRVSTGIVEWGASNLYRRTTTLEGIGFGVLLLVLIGLLLWRGGDGVTRRGALIAGCVAAFVFVAPLVLAALGVDYFLSRNEIPAFVPCAVVLAAACAAPRARVAGGLLAAVLLVVFALTAIDVQTHPYLERPNWGALARVFGGAPVPRAILVADGTTADPLKIYMPGVHWTQPLGRRTVISEVDVIGARKKLRLVVEQTPTGIAAIPPTSRHFGAALPSRVAPRGARLMSRFRFKNWVVARYALRRPLSISNGRLAQIAPRFFLRTPSTLLIFIQHPLR